MGYNIHSSIIAINASIFLPKPHLTMNPTAIVSLALIALAAGHGFISQPRMRGAIKTQRAVGSLAGEDVVGQRGWSYCPHCLNVRPPNPLQPSRPAL